MADHEDHEPPEAPAIDESEVYIEAEIVQPKPWGLWATIGWTFLAGVMYVAVTAVVAVPFL